MNSIGTDIEVENISSHGHTLAWDLSASCFAYLIRWNLEMKSAGAITKYTV